MYKSPNASSNLTSINGQSLPLRSWVTNFHLLLVVIDPFSHESSWIINTASRVLSNFTGADCRVGWLVIGDAEQAATFLGPHSDEFITFIDPNGDFVKEVGLTQTPGIIHINQAPKLIAATQGWNPEEWKAIVSGLADHMQWSRPAIPAEGDPTPYAGSSIGDQGQEADDTSPPGCGKCSVCRAGKPEKCQII
ncbi:MAG: hypothetical protein VX754_00365 [Actinomycetota bacterium]|nr:hypothetical protein [Actinomycetota bacterium]